MYERINEWSIDGQALPQPRSLVGLDLMSTEVVSQSPPLGFFIPRDLLVNPREPQQLNCFYMPLHFGDAQLAVLHLFFPPRALFTSEQIGILNEVALDMTLAIERVQLRRIVSNQRATIKEEHHRIARNLHDTLGQNLAYLRLKLDQLSGADAMKDIALIRLELERMREIADQAYNQVRGSLSELREDTIPDISRVIHDCALEAGQRAGFSVNMMSRGEPRILSVQVYKQTLFILKEALRNIEQHAEASQVWINFSWDRECLSTIIKDDGIGFDLDDSSNHYGHYGLKIIQERADEIRASLELASKINAGTELILRVPIQTGEK
jgi:two-component system nitrate/nitrite sensor histidine kinase NarX